jgi:NAD+ kinase
MKNILVVYKKSMYELYRASPDKAVRDFVNSELRDAVLARKSHANQQRTLETVINSLDREGLLHDEIYRANLGSYAGMHEKDMVVSVGGDGTFIEVSHYVSGIPVLAVNSDPRSPENPTGSVGFYCAATAETFADVLRNCDVAKQTELARILVDIDGRQLPEAVINDILVAHSNPAAVTRYRLSDDNFAQERKSSGLLVCTPSGSTAWMYNEGGQVMPLASKEMQYFSRGVRGEKTKFARELEVQSLTREGKIYLDGQHIQYDFTLGSSLRIRSGNPLAVICDLESKRNEKVQKYAQ